MDRKTGWSLGCGYPTQAKMRLEWGTQPLCGLENSSHQESVSLPQPLKNWTGLVDVRLTIE
jgi:hypothetical protein